MNIAKKLLSLPQKQYEWVCSQLTPKDAQELELQLARESFYHFVKLVIDNIGSKNPIEISEHIKIMCEILQLKYDRKLKYPHLGISIPPGHTKTLCANICYAAWVLGRSPNTRIILGMNSKDEARKTNQDLKEVILSDLYKKIFPNTQLANDNTDYIMTTLGGGRRVVTTDVAKRFTGASADLVQIDDPNDTTATQNDLEKCVDWYEKKAIRRLRYGENNLGILLIQQRTNRLDLTGHLLENSKDFFHLCLKAYEENDIIYKIPLKDDSFVNIYRKAGYLWESFNNDDNPIAYDKIRNNEYKKDVWLTQYQQEPIVSQDALVRFTPSNYIDINTLYEMQYDYIILSVDPASSENKGADNTAFIMLGFNSEQAQFYVLNVFKKRIEYTQLEEHFRFFYAECNKIKEVNIIVIEATSNGNSLYSRLKDSQVIDPNNNYPISVGMGFHKSIPRESKETRLQKVIDAVNNIKMPTNAPWLTDYVSEMIQFPNAKHDDMVDATIQGITKLLTMRNRI